MKPQKPSPALVISVVALFVALSGVALALERNSVKTQHIANETIRKKDLADGLISRDDTPPLARDGSTKIGADAIDRQEIASDAVSGSELAPSVVGDIALENVNLVAGTATTITDAEMGDGNWTGDTASVGCDSSEQLLSAYGEWTNAAGSEDTAIAEMVLNPDSGNAVVRGIQNTGGSKDLRAVALCLDD
jgi:hypothetical protein